jgi:hypothetical protein
MGMFDWIRCKVPLPDGFTGELQTKDLGNTLWTHEITEAGCLMLAGFPDGKLTASDLTGIVQFYGGRLDDWHEYKATFSDGVLVGIEPVAFPLSPERSQNDCSEC